MKTFYNEAEAYVDEMLAGIVEAHPDELKFAGRRELSCVRTAR